MSALSYVVDYWPYVLGGLAAAGALIALAVVTRSWKLLFEGLAALGLVLVGGRIYSKGAAGQRERQKAAQGRAVARTEQAKARSDSESVDELRARMLRENASDREGR